MGIITPVTHSEWAAIIVYRRKANGKLRVCADFSIGLNKALQSFDYPLPVPEDIFASLNGGTVFSQIYLSDAYLQIELSQIMNKKLSGLRGVATYLDDILVCGRTELEHKENLLALSGRIEEYGFKLRLKKCFFSKLEIRYLGFIVDRNGRRPNPEKIDAIRNKLEPKSVSQSRAFLGMVTYYSAFTPTIKNLRGSLDALSKKDVRWDWSSQHRNVFERLKSALSSGLNPAHYDPRQKIVVAADACDYGIEGVISHRYPDGSEKPSAHASRSLTSAEKNYSQIEKEAFALVFTVKKFHNYVFGRRFLLLTDHRPLLAILGDKKGVPIYSANRLMRWATTLLGYDFDIEYVNTAKFGQADGLSTHRSEEEDIVIAVVESDVSSTLRDCIRKLPVTHEDVEVCTERDPVLKKVKACVRTGRWVKGDSKLIPYYNRKETLSVVGNCIMTGERPNIDKDCEDVVKTCTNCQENAKSPVKVPLETWPTPTHAWERIHVDFAGPMHDRYYMVVVDAFSKWPEMVEKRSISAGETVKVLKGLFARYGFPQSIVSDNGTQFVFELFRKMCDEGGIAHIRTATYHPQSNGQANRFVDTLKRGIKKLKGEEKPTEETLNVVLEASYEGDASVFVQQWKAPHFIWKKAVVKQRVGAVLYEVELDGKLQYYMQQSESIRQQCIDNPTSSSRTPTVATQRPPPALPRSTRIRRPVQRYAIS
ncbi:unnamed protein product [Nippostrongylus brasiliensis]|uniref:RNA-directed DNA polymerase n=1 Tax=Nippostrongylus brasiliensis TaxID=27835 RepID=A0A0N4XI86_NIPBR|nr:unnamed protein product [Nippostrongylus brasiliensis]